MNKILLLWAVTSLLCSQSAAAENAESNRPSEYEVKAAFIYNFARFVEWTVQNDPARAEGFSIGVLGQDPFGALLESTFADKTIGGAQVKIVRAQVPSKLTACQILFISESEKPRFEQIETDLKGRQILTIADFPGFVDAGGMIELRVEENRVRFWINQKKAIESGLKISSKLLSLAQKVVTK